MRRITETHVAVAIVTMATMNVGGETKFVSTPTFNGLLLQLCLYLAPLTLMHVRISCGVADNNIDLSFRPTNFY